jgi:hypothetical protein
MTHYSLLIGSSGGGLPATSFVELTSGSGTFSVPTGYNAIHIQYAVGGGGGAMRGADYDKAGGESAGAGGGSGAYISDKVFTVTEGETISYSVGSSGANGTGVYSGSAGGGASTTISGSTTGSIFTLTGGGGASASGGGVQGPLRSNTAGTAGSATISGSAVTSGIFVDSDNSVKNVTSNTSGPTGVFNQSGNGAAGGNGTGNCGGDNCRIDGFQELLLMQEMFLVDQEDHLQEVVQQEVQVQEDLEVEVELHKFRAARHLLKGVQAEQVKLNIDFYK